MIEVKDLRVHYGGIVALDGISLSIPDGKIISIVGANGAGKSTTINAISGMVKIQSGSVTLDGESLLVSPQEIVKRGIVQVPEGRRIFPLVGPFGDASRSIIMLVMVLSYSPNPRLSILVASYGSHPVAQTMSPTGRLMVFVSISRLIALYWQVSMHFPHSVPMHADQSIT